MSHRYTHSEDPRGGFVFHDDGTITKNDPQPTTEPSESEKRKAERKFEARKAQIKADPMYAGLLSDRVGNRKRGRDRVRGGETRYAARVIEDIDAIFRAHNAAHTGGITEDGLAVGLGDDDPRDLSSKQRSDLIEIRNEMQAAQTRTRKHTKSIMEERAKQHLVKRGQTGRTTMLTGASSGAKAPSVATTGTTLLRSG